MSGSHHHPQVLLSAYLDGELSGEERRLVNRHLADCGRCRGELDDLADVRSRLRGLPWLDPPELAESEPAGRPASVGRRAAVGAVAASVVLVVAVMAVAATPRQEPIATAELSTLLASYSAAGPRVEQFVPPTTGEPQWDPSVLPTQLDGVPRRDLRGWDEQGILAHYDDGDVSFVVLTSQRPLDTSRLQHTKVKAGNGEYVRAQGEGKVMYVWRADTAWFALLGVMSDSAARRVLSELPPPVSEDVLSVLWRRLSD